MLTTVHGAAGVLKTVMNSLAIQVFTYRTTLVRTDRDEDDLLRKRSIPSF